MPLLPLTVAASSRHALVHVPPASARHESLRERVACIARTLFVGCWASLVDLGLLAACLHWLMLGAMPSRLVALAVSGALLFFGSRSYAFRAGAGCATKQARRFVVAELAGLGLNLLSFRVCSALAPGFAPEWVSLVANFFVFAGFSYPIRRYVVFRVASR